MDSWYLAPDIVVALKEHQLNWVSLLKKNRKLEVKSIEELILLAHDRLLQGQSADEVFSRLFAKQRKEVPA